MKRSGAYLDCSGLTRPTTLTVKSWIPGSHSVFTLKICASICTHVLSRGCSPSGQFNICSTRHKRHDILEKMKMKKRCLSSLFLQSQHLTPSCHYIEGNSVHLEPCQTHTLHILVANSFGGGYHDKKPSTLYRCLYSVYKEADRVVVVFNQMPFLSKPQREFVSHIHTIITCKPVRMKRFWVSFWNKLH